MLLGKFNMKIAVAKQPLVREMNHLYHKIPWVQNMGGRHDYKTATNIIMPRNVNFRIISGHFGFVLS